MKKFFILVLTCMLFLVCVKAKTKKKYLALGDSITAGYLLENPEEDCFASIFSKKYGFELTNEAVTGDESWELLERLDNYNIDDYDVITLCIGANDVLGRFVEKFNELSTAELADFIATVSENKEFNDEIDNRLKQLDNTLETIMGILKQGHAEIYMMNIYNPYKDHVLAKLEDIADPYIKKLNNVVEKHAKEVNFVNLYKTFNKSKKTIINSQNPTTIHDPHPNAEGHKLIAKTLIDSYYKNNPEPVYIILAIVIGVVVLFLEVIEIVFTAKKFVVKPIIKTDRPKKEEENNSNTNNSSRFIRS